MVAKKVKHLKKNALTRMALIVYSVAIVLFVAEASTKVFPNAAGITKIATLSTGPFAVRTVETPSVANTNIGRDALRQRQPEFARSTINGGVASPSLFQTADGRVFALSNGRNGHQFAPGQIFQSVDGRFFTIAAVSSTEAQQSALPQHATTPSVPSAIPNQQSSLFQEPAATNEVIDARINVPSIRRRVSSSVSSSSTSFRPTPMSTTTESAVTPQTTSSSDISSIPSTSSSQVTKVAQPSSTSKSNLKVLNSFNDIFGKRTRPLTPASTLPITIAQKRLTNQNTLSSFDLRKIARKNKSISDAAAKNTELQALNDARFLQQKQEAEIQQEQQIQQQLRLQIQRQKLQLKRLQQMQLELQQQQEQRQRELSQRHQEKQESLRMQQQRQLEDLSRKQKMQLEELQTQQGQEQEAQLAQIKRDQKSIDGFETPNTIVTNTIIASAPLTPATSRFIAVPAVPAEQRILQRQNGIVFTRGMLNISSASNEMIAEKSLTSQSPKKPQPQSSKIPRTQRVVTRIGARRRVNRLRGRQRSSVNNLVRTTPVATFQSNIRKAPKTTASHSKALVSGYFTSPSTGVYYNF